MRLHLLGSRDLWVDESASVLLGRMPWKDFWATVSNSQANMSFYYVLLRGWLHLGDSEAVVRSLSVLFGVAAIPMIYVLGNRLFGRKAAVIASALSAVNAFQVRYSQEARGYSLVLLLVVLSTYLFVRAVESPDSKSYWAGYVVVSVLGVYTHTFVGLVVLAHWLSLIPSKLRSVPRTIFLLSVAAFGLLSLPMIAFDLTRTAVLPNFIPRPSIKVVSDFAVFLTGNCGWILILAYVGACIAALSRLSGASDLRTAPDQRWQVTLVTLWLAFPIVSTLAISMLKPVFYDRYMAICAPALALLAGQGIAQLDQLRSHASGLSAISALVVLGLSVWGIHRYDMSPSSGGDNWRLVTQHILAQQEGGDTVFFYRESGSWPFSYYVEREMEAHVGTAPPVVTFPPGVRIADRIEVNLDPNLEPSKEDVQAAMQKSRRLWLVLQHYKGIPAREATAQDIQRTLQQAYRLSAQRVFPGVTGDVKVLLYVRNPAPAGS